eukprot:scaffold222332_cov18-Tisochrysis_lutea.AAC.2
MACASNFIHWLRNGVKLLPSQDPRACRGTIYIAAVCTAPSDGFKEEDGFPFLGQDGVPHILPHCDHLKPKFCIISDEQHQQKDGVNWRSGHSGVC